MAPFKVRSPLAMQITRADRQKFNEAVANGFYPCAPDTIRGSSRIFDENDLVSLFIFARLLEFGLPPRSAGSLACKFMEKSSNNPEEDRIVFAKGISGAGHFFLGGEYDPDIEKKGRFYHGISPVAFTVDFHVSNIRAIIRREIEAERMIIGADEDESEG